MKASAIYLNSFLTKEFGRAYLDQISRYLRSIGELSAFEDMSREQIALYVFCVMAADKPADVPTIARNYRSLQNAKGKKFNSVWKSFMDAIASQGESLNHIERLYISDAGSYVSVHLDDDESDIFHIPGYRRPDKQYVKNYSGKWLFGMLFNLQNAEKQGFIIKD